jgi:cyclopropane fatty-acyl-phospholipid synthase-like methyltransferase
VSDPSDSSLPAFYARFYTATQTSHAYAEFCRRLFGADFTQHGFSDQAQVAKLLEVTQLGPGHHALDLGCGNGRMAAYIAAATGAHVTGIDNCPEAIEQAQRLAAADPAHLHFELADIGALALQPATFELAISIDSLYFVEDRLDDVLARIAAALRPAGRMAIYYAHGSDPQRPLERFDRATLAPAMTPLGQALTRLGFPFQTWDFTAEDADHARRKQALLEELEPAFSAEGTHFLYENRYAEAIGVAAAIAAGAHARYLYLVCPGSEPT